MINIKSKKDFIRLSVEKYLVNTTSKNITDLLKKVYKLTKAIKIKSDIFINRKSNKGYINFKKLNISINFKFFYTEKDKFDRNFLKVKDIILINKGEVVKVWK